MARGQRFGGVRGVLDFRIKIDALAIVGVIPRVLVAATAAHALVYVPPPAPGVVRFLDYEPAPWVVALFALAHLWLALNIVDALVSPRPETDAQRPHKVLTILLAAQLALVYALTWLVRQHGLSVW